MQWGDDAPLETLTAIKDAEELCRQLLASPWGWGSSTRHTEAVELLASVQRLSRPLWNFGGGPGRCVSGSDEGSDLLGRRGGVKLLPDRGAELG